MKKCSYADKYKAIHPPKCNNGDPCDTCKTKWEAEQKALEEDAMREMGDDRYLYG